MQTTLNNRYRVVNTLGSGGFGETFLAEDTQMPSNRYCVIKQLRPIQNNPQIYQLVKERFQREAAILEDLGGNNDQIPTLYAYFQNNDQFYLVQEYVEGDTLTNLAQRQGLLSESSVKEILTSLLPVLEYVHSKRIVHRDIKPDNILIRRSDRKPVLIDFGAVRESMGTVVNSQGNPTSSIVIGTPGYMPNEQAAGRPLYSSDLYSLGMTAIYLLTRKQPQELESDPRTAEILWRHHALNVSPTFAAVLDKAIAYHPRDRFASAKEMLDAIYSQRSGTISPQLNAPYQQQAYKQPQVTQPSPPQNTVPIGTPVQYQQPSQPINQNNNSKSILIAGLVAGAIVGASAIIGMALFNKQPQPVAQKTEQTTSSNTDSENPSTTVQKPQVTEPEKIISPESSPTPSETVSKPLPEQFIRSYYDNINNREYQTAWNQLSLQHQNNTESHPKGYDSFTEWWVLVDRANILQVSSRDVTNNNAVVNTQVQYLTKSGNNISQSLRFFLVWDTTSQNWLIERVQKIN